MTCMSRTHTCLNTRVRSRDCFFFFCLYIIYTAPLSVTVGSISGVEVAKCERRPFWNCKLHTLGIVCLFLNAVF